MSVGVARTIGQGLVRYDDSLLIIDDDLFVAPTRWNPYTQTPYFLWYNVSS